MTTTAAFTDDSQSVSQQVICHRQTWPHSRLGRGQEKARVSTLSPSNILSSKSVSGFCKFTVKRLDPRGSILRTSFALLV